MSNPPRGYMKPKSGDPKMIRDENNGQFANPPLMMEMGKFKDASDLKRTGQFGNPTLHRLPRFLVERDHLGCHNRNSIGG